MTIKQQGGIFGRNPTFNDVTIDSSLLLENKSGVAEATIRSTVGAARLNITSTGGSSQLRLGDVDDVDIGLISYSQVANAMQIFTNNSLAATFTSSGNLAFPNGKGIDFSATAGTGTSELFDDYEEGTWTPSVSAGAITGTGITYTGTYTKIGRNVTLFFNANSATADIAVASYVIFSGLPFTVTGNIGSGTIVTEDVDATSRQGFVGLGASTLFVGACGGGTTSDLYCSITYYTS